jgi:MFS family permease
MRTEFGWSGPATAGAFSAGLLASALAAMPIGRLIDRHGARGVMTAGSCVAALLLAAWSRVDSLPALYATWIGLGLTMSAVLYEPAFAVLVRWFGQRRALALSILTSVGGLASTVFVPVAVWLIAQGSWRSAVLTLAVILAATTIPVHAFLLRTPPSMGELRSNAEPALPSETVTLQHPTRVVPSRLEWWLAATFSVSTLSAAAAAVHVMPYLLGRGHSLGAASLVLAVMGAAQVPGRLLFAPLTRLLPERSFGPGVFLVQAIGLICLAFTGSSLTSALLFAVVFGAGSGLTTLVRPLVVAEWFGVARYGVVSGRVAMFGQLSRAAGPFVAALVATVSSYRAVWLTLALAAIASGIMLELLTRMVEDLAKTTSPV